MLTTDQRRALERVVAIVNDKGGVGKTSTTANVGAELAARGQRILLIDLDVSGNLRFDLGLSDDPRDDRGKSTVDAVWSGDPMRAIENVRPNLDMIFGGRGLELLAQLARSASADSLPHGSVPEEFAARLAEVADSYDLVLLDCPPGLGDLQDMAVAAARWVLIPTKTDEASLDGLQGVGPRVARARRTNPTIAYLGAVITLHQTTASRVRAQVEKKLTDEVGDRVPLFDTKIRFSETAADDCRARGEVAREVAAAAKKAKNDRLKVLRQARRDGTSSAEALAQIPTMSASAVELAKDYQRLADEIIRRIAAAERVSA